MSGTEDTRTLKAHCYCKAVNYTVTVPKSALPLKVRLCHCNACRYTHGTFSVFNTDLPRDVKPDFVAPSSMAALTKYHHGRASCARLFCSTCGAHVADIGVGGEDDGQWVVASSLFEEHGPDVFQVALHVFTKSAHGGGIDGSLPRIRGQPMRVWNPDAGDAQFGDPVNEPPPREVDDKGNERLRAQCHCGGVSFTIPRPTVPEAADDGYIRGFISPLDKTKWVACLDVCDDCRLVNGTHVCGWTFIPLALVEPPIAPSFNNHGTLKAFESSPGTKRGFCGVCGATVLFGTEDRAPTERQRIVDVSVGVLRSPGGVMATDWLTWRTTKIAWLDSGERYDPDFTAALKEGFDEWGVKVYGEEIKTFNGSIG